jgi:hypothetical protein
VTQIIVYFAIATVAVISGYILRVAFERMTPYDGVMTMIHEEDKLVYSLEILEDIDELQFKDRIVFKVQTSEEVLNRE